jgi:long-chain acyl-CoA synthetase
VSDFGGQFATVHETVHGISIPVYRDRFHSLRELFDFSVTRYAELTHLVFGTQRVTFADMAERVPLVAGGLSRRGVVRGARVAILAANHPAWAETLWATTQLGGVVVGLNGWWAPDELDFAIRDSEPEILIVDPRRLERIAHLLGGNSPVRHVLVIDGDGKEDGATEPYAALLEGPPDTAVHEVDEDDPAVMLYTSGTTGRSKGAIWTHRSMIAALQSHAHRLAVGRARRGRPESSQPSKSKRQVALLVSVPMFHTSGLHAGVVTAMATGAKAVILEGRFRPDEVLRLIQDEQVVAWAAVPTMVLRVVDDPELQKFDVSSLRSISYGGSPSSADLQERARTALGVAVRLGNSYGLTETTSAIMVNEGEEFAQRPDSVGRPNPLLEVRIVDEDDNEVPNGVRGEIAVKGAVVIPGYWRNPEATTTAIRDGWFHTGDIGERDDEGYVYIRDRAKDMIIRGGENVYCAEIEDRLEQHPAVIEAAIIGSPHPVLGEEVKAVVRVEDGAGVTSEELQAWAGERLAHFKVPSLVEFVREPLPRTPSGKVLKTVLRGEPATTAPAIDE